MIPARAGGPLRPCVPRTIVARLIRERGSGRGGKMTPIDAPVTELGEGTASGPLEETRGLCLSGGGYRAMLFHLGVVWRLNELGMLPTLSRISSVSGGSITAAVLGVRWSQLTFVAGVATNFEPLVVVPLRKLAGKTLDAVAIVKGVLLPGSINDKFAAALDQHLFTGATLQDLPESPRFVINATNLQTGKLWRFSRPFMGDWTIGQILTPKVALAKAAAASAAFPPVLSPAILKVKPQDFAPGAQGVNRLPQFMSRIVLSDGGVYDNLGLETCFKRCRTLLVSDAGMRPAAEEQVRADPVRQTIRVLEVVDAQVRALRSRQLLGCFTSSPPTRNGAYWSANSDITNYSAPNALPCPVARSRELARVPTRLAKLSGELQDRLINWGYAICDAAVRTHVDPHLAAPSTFPCKGGV